MQHAAENACASSWVGAGCISQQKKERHTTKVRNEKKSAVCTFYKVVVCVVAPVVVRIIRYHTVIEPHHTGGWNKSSSSIYIFYCCTTETLSSSCPRACFAALGSLGQRRLTVVDEDVGAASRPLVGLDGCPLDVVRARKVDGDEVGLVHGQLPRLEDGEEQVELRAVPRENHHRSASLELCGFGAKGRQRARRRESGCEKKRQK